MTKIGLEIHGYLNTKEKLFCKCKAIHGKKHIKPNTSICPICSGQPGAKPMLPNKSATNKVIQIALILGCKINEKLIWQRKHYNWPDLPKGYQNTISGSYAIPVGQNGKFSGIRITECHLEEDPASWNPITGEIDYDKSGSPLIEIVTEPEFIDSEQVIEWLKQLNTTLSYIKAIDKTSGIKADINVSTTGKRVEIKNINSLKNIKSAIEYEIRRQKKEIPKIQETRMFDESKGVTIKMRTKEETEDYRFIGDPDLPIIKIEKLRIKNLYKNLPETPHKKLERLIKKHKIEKKHAEILTKKLEIVEFFEKVIKKIKPKLAIHWITIELLRVLNYTKKEMEDVNIDPYHFIELMNLVDAGKITELKAKEILNEFVPNSFSPGKKVQKHSKISKTDIIEIYVKQAIKENAKAVEDYKLGKNESLHFLIGQVMRISNKRADFKAVRKVLEKMLK
ncbi:Asp-tRNA(Asn)/Glu-tRNA(Gln) amidotransferase GatCAB subunit B [Candidatus Pacearchaeota archaeon]|jgi:aspartyl-tRNA(Asn)/glutamyl-tRNA(Gln) amidotransferase subunit B|nr:Asp-tRNA(Asn)/Glu-tRNA(Gln) amidotransferase GatCAB subunit B [Candidatus Pacearchaeota archaeon]|tara:strand:- start:3341 stop:4693 length:1353 start_codon:yes stop_codon:yes gene_type:complete